MTVHAVAARPPAHPKAASAAEGADAAAGDLFASLVAALLPQVAAVTGDAPSGDGTGTTADGPAVPAPASPATGGVVDLTTPALDAGAVVATVPMPTDGDSAAGDMAATAAGASTVPVLEALATNRPVPAVATTGKDDATGKAQAAVTAPANPQPAPVDGDQDAGAPTAAAGATTAPRAAAKRPTVDAEPEAKATDDAPPVHATPAPHQTAVHATERTSETAPVAAPAPHQQLASVIKPLSRRADGTYHLALRLHPEHLGAVDVDVELHQGTVQVHVHTQHEEARDLLLTHIDDLRRELEHAGLRAGMLDVSDRGQRQQPGLPGEARTLRNLGSPDVNADGPAAPSTTTRPAPAAATDGAVDIQL